MAPTRTVESGDGHTLAYDVVGSGPAVVLLPGALMGRSWWHDIGYVDRLASGFTVLSVDPLAHGESDHPHDPAAYDDGRVVDHLLAVLDAEGIERCVLWGFSRGGTIASLAARAVPERVELAVLGSAPPHGSVFPEEMVDAMLAGDWAPFVELAVAGGLADAQTCERLIADHDPAAWGAALRARGRLHWDRFEVPVVAYVGDGETMRDQVCADAQRLEFPMAVLPTGGHMETFTTIDPVMGLIAPFLTN